MTRGSGGARQRTLRLVEPTEPPQAEAPCPVCGATDGMGLMSFRPVDRSALVQIPCPTCAGKQVPAVVLPWRTDTPSTGGAA